MTQAIEELHDACPNVTMKVRDVELDQHYFMKETFSHPTIFGEPYLTATQMEMKVLHNGSTYTLAKSQDGKNSI